jgi:hypothetical protein
MDDRKLERLLKAEGAQAEPPGRNCPDEALLSAYVELEVSDEQRAKVEAHLADCEACLGQVAFLVRQRADLGAPVVPGAVARARDLVALPPRSWRPLVLRWGAALVGVAAVAVAAALVFRSPEAPQGLPVTPVHDGLPAASAPASLPEPAPVQAVAGSPAPLKVTAPEAGSRKPEAGVAAPRATPPEPAPTVRRSSSPAPTLAVLSPVEAATLVRKDLEFRWHAVPRSLYYEINVVTEDGNLVYQARVEETTARLPDGTTLEPGVKYFVWIKAFLAGGELVKSATVSFRVAGQ